ncbi:MAG: RNA methyltransferase [Chitinophagaceae bacterium]|nr:RNA methyltransferase [Chitinophagaceae bacterium]
MDELNRKTVEEFRAAEKHPVIVVLDNVRSMHNVGSIFRTADAFLIESIYLCGYTPRPPHRDIQKTALGATETVHWEYFSSTADAVQQIKAMNGALWAAEQAEGSIDLDKINWDMLTQHATKRKTAILFGNEVTGVDDHILSLCDGCMEIPQTGMKHSLNISVAAGIVLWEVYRSIRNNNS